MMKRTTVLILCLLLVSPFLAAQTSSKRLDTTTFVVMGESMAAGVYNFSLNSKGQENSFPALIAKQVGTILPQPNIQPPGIGNVVGYNELPLRIPAALQTTVRKPFPPYLFVFNLSVPGLRLSESMTRRPTLPLIQDQDRKQTLVNFVLGYPQLILEDDVPLWTQLDYARAMRPTFALVELGYSEVVEAAATGDFNRLPDLNQFRSDYEAVVAGLRSTYAEVVVANVPNPLDTSFANSPISSAQLLRVPSYVVLGLYGLTVDDWITVPGLVEIGNQLLARTSGSLPNGSIITAEAAADLTAYVNQMNSVISDVAGRHGALVYDLNAQLSDLKENGVVVGGKQLGSDFLGGLYSLSGYYPGPTGHALIANGILTLLNSSYGKNYPLVSVEEILAHDSVADYRVSTGSETTLEELSEFLPPEKMRNIQRVKAEFEGRRPVDSSRSNRKTIQPPVPARRNPR
jgi:hypothetical protein